MIKWLTGISPTDRTVYVACRSIESRLDAVRHYLRRSVKKPDKPENVHQLRVWCRRSETALSLYAELIPRRKLKWLFRVVKRLRRTAGAIRDCDVLEATGHATTKLDAERIKAQRKLVGLFEKLDCGRRLKKVTSRLIRELRKRQANSSETFRHRANKSLESIATGFFLSDPGSAGNPEKLHRFRIAGKELRYAIELVASAFPVELRTEIYPMLSDLQEKLGRVNDLAVASERLASAMKKSGNAAELTDLRRRLSAASDELFSAQQEFLRSWTPENAQIVHARFDDLLAASDTIR